MLMGVLRDILHAGLRARSRTYACPVCARASDFLGDVDFNKSCADRDGTPVLPSAGRPVSYFYCKGCGFCFAPEFQKWPIRKFRKLIYNDEYVRVDPDYVSVRPRNSATFVERNFAPVRLQITHLDYGGGNGLMSELLRDGGWRSTSYDEFEQGPEELAKLSTYDLITAFEVFEHVPNPQRLMAHLARVTHPQSLLVFTTLLSDGYVAPGMGLDWWYLAPRNGHVSLYSTTSLSLMLHAHGYRLILIGPGLHAAFRERPEWSRGLSILPAA